MHEDSLLIGTHPKVAYPDSQVPVRVTFSPAVKAAMLGQFHIPVVAVDVTVSPGQGLKTYVVF